MRAFFLQDAAAGLLQVQGRVLRRQGREVSPVRHGRQVPRAGRRLLLGWLRRRPWLLLHPHVIRPDGPRVCSLLRSVTGLGGLRFVVGFAVAFRLLVGVVVVAARVLRRLNQPQPRQLAPLPGRGLQFSCIRSQPRAALEAVQRRLQVLAAGGVVEQAQPEAVQRPRLTRVLGVQTAAKQGIRLTQPTRPLLGVGLGQA